MTNDEFFNRGKASGACYYDSGESLGAVVDNALKCAPFRLGFCEGWIEMAAANRNMSEYERAKMRANLSASLSQHYGTAEPLPPQPEEIQTVLSARLPAN